MVMAVPEHGHSTLVGRHQVGPPVVVGVGGHEVPGAGRQLREGQGFVATAQEVPEEDPWRALAGHGQVDSLRIGDQVEAGGGGDPAAALQGFERKGVGLVAPGAVTVVSQQRGLGAEEGKVEVGRASCRERV